MDNPPIITVLRGQEPTTVTRGDRPGSLHRPGPLLALCLLLPLAALSRFTQAVDPPIDPVHLHPLVAVTLPQAPEAAPAGAGPRVPLSEAPDTGVDYYVYTQFRPDLDAPLTACTPIPTGATPSAGEYLFQAVIVPSALALREESPFMALAERPWAAVRAELRYSSDSGGLIRIAERLPLVEPLVGSAPADPKALRPADNLWGYRPGGSYRGTPDWHAHGLPWLMPLVRAGQGRASSASPETQEVALLRTLCDAAPITEREADGFRLYRLQRLLSADYDNPGEADMLRRLWLFFSPVDRADGHAGLLAALKDDASHNTGFARALYLNGSPTETHRKLFARFQTDVERFLSAAQRRPQTTGPAPASPPLSLPPARPAEPEPEPQTGTTEPPRIAVPSPGATTADVDPGWSVAGWLLGVLVLVGLAVMAVVRYRKPPTGQAKSFRRHPHPSRSALPTSRPSIGESDFMASVISDDSIPETSSNPRPGASRLTRMPVEAPADPGPTVALLSEPALAAAAAALEATADRLLAERDLMERRCAELEQRLAVLERHAQSAGSLSQADLRQAVDPLAKGLRRQELVLVEQDARYRDHTGGAFKRLEQEVETLSARLTAEFDEAALAARVGRLLDDRLSIGLDALTSRRLDDLSVQVKTLAHDLAEQSQGRSAAAAEETETGARLERLAAAYQDLAGDLASLKQTPPAAEPDVQTAQLVQLAARIATLEDATVPPGPGSEALAPVDPAPDATDAESAVTTAALADLVERLKAAEVFRESAWGARTRFLDDPEALAAWLIADYLPPNLPLPVLKSLDDWLAEHFADSVRLILPGAGAPFDSGTHERIETVTGTGGMLRSVLKLVRPGLRCQGEVRRKAEVVAS